MIARNPDMGYRGTSLGGFTSLRAVQQRRRQKARFGSKGTVGSRVSVSVCLARTKKGSPFDTHAMSFLGGVRNAALAPIRLLTPRPYDRAQEPAVLLLIAPALEFVPVRALPRLHSRTAHLDR